MLQLQYYQATMLQLHHFTVIVLQLPAFTLADATVCTSE